MSDEEINGQKVNNFAQTNWLEHYFWPFGRTSTAEFGRGWLMVVIGQFIMLKAALVLLLFKATVPGMVLLVGALVFGSYMVGMLHIRRLHDRGWNGWPGFFAYIPMVLALGLLVAPQQQQKERRQAPQEAATTEETAAAQDEASSESKATKESASNKEVKAEPKKNTNREARRAMRQQQAGGRRGGKGRRGGRAGNNGQGGQSGQGKPQNMAFQKAMGAVGIFAGLAFIMSMFSLIGIHRLKVQPASNRWGVNR